MLGTQPPVVILKVGCWLLVVCCCLLLIYLLNQLYYCFGGGRKVFFNTPQLCFVLFSFSFFFFFFLVELFLGCCVLSVSVLNHCFLLGTTATFFPLTPLFSYFYISIPCK